MANSKLGDTPKQIIDSINSKTTTILTTTEGQELIQVEDKTLQPVTRNTNQTISGTKIISGNLQFDGGSHNLKSGSDYSGDGNARVFWVVDYNGYKIKNYNNYVFYTPSGIQFSLTGNYSSPYNLSYPNKSGTIALISDIQNQWNGVEVTSNTTIGELGLEPKILKFPSGETPNDYRDGYWLYGTGKTSSLTYILIQCLYDTNIKYFATFEGGTATNTTLSSIMGNGNLIKPPEWYRYSNPLTGRYGGVMTIIDSKTSPGNFYNIYNPQGSEGNLYASSPSVGDIIFSTHGEIGIVVNKQDTGSSYQYDVKTTYIPAPFFIVTDLTSTDKIISAQPNTRYVLGTLSSLSLDFHASGSEGDEIIIEFVSGSTATTLTRDNTNAIYNFSTISANTFVELHAAYKASINKWVVLSSETEYSV